MPGIAHPACVEITVNGQRQQAPRGATIADLLQSLGLSARHVAVEVNLELIPRSRHAEHQLAAGDSLEVVSLVGGG